MRNEHSGPAAWHGPEMATRDDWLSTFSDADIAEIEAAVAGARERGLDIVEVTGATSLAMSNCSQVFSIPAAPM